MSERAANASHHRVKGCTDKGRDELPSHCRVAVDLYKPVVNCFLSVRLIPHTNFNEDPTFLDLGQEVTNGESVRYCGVPVPPVVVPPEFRAMIAYGSQGRNQS